MFTKRRISFILCYLFLFGIVIGRLCWERIFLPFSNPWHVLGELNRIKYSPLTNILRFIIFVLCPVVTLVSAYVLAPAKIKSTLFFHRDHQESIASRQISSSKGIFIAFFLIYSVLIAINNPNINFGIVDPFHEGESLGTAISLEQGQIPYKDFVFLHGTYQDPLRSVIAFKLFGKSISASRIVDSFNNLLVHISLAVFLVKLYRGKTWQYLAAMTILAILEIRIPQLLIILSRDMMIFAFLTGIVVLSNYTSEEEHEISVKEYFSIPFILGFLPIVSFVYSIDRGFYLLATATLILPLIFYYILRNRKQRVYFMFAISSGMLFGIFLLTLLLREGFYDFFEYVFRILPKYKGFLDGRVFPINSGLFFFPCIIMAFNTYWIAYRFLKELYINHDIVLLSLKSFVRNYLAEIGMFILSFFTFASALDRSDLYHVAYSSVLMYCLLFFILIKYVIPSFSHVTFQVQKVKVLMGIVITSFTVLLVIRIFTRDLIKINFPYGIEDSQLIPESYKSTIFFLKKNVNQNNEFITMTNEPIWYYFIDRPCPIRFPVIWFAAPDFYQKEVVNNLKKRNVNFILYNNKFVTNINFFDGSKPLNILPIITDYIRNNYVFYKNFDGNEIWIRKEKLNQSLNSIESDIKSEDNLSHISFL